MVLAMALTEGVANDWLGVAMVDGYGAPAWLGAAAFALFVAAMTAGPGRRHGAARHVRPAPGALGQHGASPRVGVLLVVLGQLPCSWSPSASCCGASAPRSGFPVGMSAAADDPAKAAARVSVVSTIGYTAFLAGPPLLGFLGSHFGVLDALLVVSVILVPVGVRRARRPQAGPVPVAAL